MQYSLKYIAILVLIYFLSGFNGVNAEVDILSRNQWKAQPAKETDIITNRIEEKLVKRKPAVYLTVHHNQERVNEIPLDQQLKSIRY